MFCSRCGKKINDDMLFCPFCGSSVVIPAQSDPEPVKAPEPVAAPTPVNTVPVRRGQTAAAQPSRQTVNVRKPAEPAPVRREKPEPAPETPVMPAIRRQPEAPQQAAKPAPQRPGKTRSVYDIEPEPEEADPGKRLPDDDAEDIPETEHFKWRMPRLPGASRKNRDAVPVFDEDEPDEEEDAYDEIDRREKKHPHRKYTHHRYEENDDEEDEDEDEEDAFEDTFVSKHLRGLIGGLLLLVLLMVLLLYLFSGSGQDALARVNLAWKPDAYARLGWDYYNAGSYVNAGKCYEQALKRSPGNWDYATSAANAYLSALDDNATERMLKEAINIRPNAVEPYLRLLNMYPNAALRPDEITTLIRQGWQLTGDTRLNIGE